MSVKQVFREHDPLTEGAPELRSHVVRRVRTQNLQTISRPKPAAAAIAAFFGEVLKDVQAPYIDRELGVEVTPLRWMKPGPDGQLVPDDHG